MTCLPFLFSLQFDNPVMLLFLRPERNIFLNVTVHNVVQTNTFITSLIPYWMYTNTTNKFISLACLPDVWNVELLPIEWLLPTKILHAFLIPSCVLHVKSLKIFPLYVDLVRLETVHMLISHCRRTRKQWSTLCYLVTSDVFVTVIEVPGRWIESDGLRQQ